MKDDAKQIQQRVMRYWYSDGIGELAGGGVFILLAVYFTAQQYFGDSSLAGGLLQAFLVFVLIGSIFLGRRVINSLKERLTYPRTGYVEYRQNNSKAKWTRLLAAFVAMGVAMASVFITEKFDSIDAMVAISGALVAFILLIKQGWSFGVARFYFFSLLSVLLGLGLSVSGLERGFNLGLFYGVMGLVFAISGGLTLKRYLDENPLPAEAMNER